MAFLDSLFVQIATYLICQNQGLWYGIVLFTTVVLTEWTYTELVMANQGLGQCREQESCHQHHCLNPIRHPLSLPVAVCVWLWTWVFCEGQCMSCSLWHTQVCDWPPHLYKIFGSKPFTLLGESMHRQTAIRSAKYRVNKVPSTFLAYYTKFRN